MGRNGKRNRELNKSLNDIRESSRVIAENTGQTNKKLDAIKDDTSALRKSNTSKIPMYSLIVAVIGVIVAFSGVTAVEIYDRWYSKSEAEAAVEAGAETKEKVSSESPLVAEEPEYEICLYPEYSIIDIYTKVKMTATLNFETDSVNITAYFESGGDETVPLEEKNATKWENMVYFDKLGVHKIVVTAKAPNGEIIENSKEVEVIPISIDMDMAGQIFTTVFNDLVEDFQTESSADQSELSAYSSFLVGDRMLLDDGQSEIWWIPDFQEEGMEYEYTCLDLDGDEVAELMIQMVDDPCGYNGVFHFENGKLFCWYSDAVEISCRDYPLADGTMVRQYDYNGTSTYTIFRYLNNGEKEDISCFFAREELIPEDSSEPCPYYMIDGEEVDKSVFYEQLRELVTDRMLDRAVWKKV